RFKFGKREKTNAGECSTRRQCPMSELSRNQDRRHGGNFGSVARVGGQVPRQTASRAVLSHALQTHQHTAAIPPEDVEKRGCPVQQRGGARKLQGHSTSSQRCSGPEC